ncbi:MAG: 1-acyl-sn-glycerol-3-phosphate acyltransferase [Planctomycetaceae bacterium]|nr:1-acyl-sn-glycerol-3-phosphate acyltransferase [Planctomycetaceae bacterium]
MDPTQFRKPDRWWSPMLQPWLVRCCRFMHTNYRINTQKMDTVEIRGLEHLQKALDENAGILITPNHSAHADAVVMYHTAHEAQTCFYFMTAWQVLGLCGKLRSWYLRSHGCFSVDREGTDLRSFKQATKILQSGKYPLVIFPEGEVYHINERVTPFREGAAAIALSAARRADRKIYAIPCGLRYLYTEDPTDELLELMSQLEESMHWRPRPEVPLQERIYRLAEGILSLKELEYLGEARKGRIPERVFDLSDEILKPLETKYGVENPSDRIPERVKAVRQKAIEQLEKLTESTPAREACYRDLDDVYLVTQMFSYPGDYVAESPSIERMAETLDKFEEDILSNRTARIRGRRRAVVSFGEPIDVTAIPKSKTATRDLAHRLEQDVQALLDSVRKD